MYMQKYKKNKPKNINVHIVVNFLSKSVWHGCSRGEERFSVGAHIGLQKII